jgi:hypothetical protein
VQLEISKNSKLLQYFEISNRLKSVIFIKTQLKQINSSGNEVKMFIESIFSVVFQQNFFLFYFKKTQLEKIKIKKH